MSKAYELQYPVNMIASDSAGVSDSDSDNVFF